MPLTARLLLDQWRDALQPRQCEELPVGGLKLPFGVWRVARAHQPLPGFHVVQQTELDLPHRDEQPVGFGNAWRCSDLRLGNQFWNLNQHLSAQLVRARTQAIDLG